jgi:hypothetical protein
VKVPLKVKIFLWYLRRGVILTKDNLAKRNWKGSKTCCFYHKDETIQHLFFQCRLSRLVWSVIHLASNLKPPRNVGHMFGSCLSCVPKEMRNLLLMGATALCWSIWLSRNGVIKMVSSPSQVITLVTRWLCTWAILHQPGLRDTITVISRQLDQVVHEFFTQEHGWRSSLRIDSY